MNVESFYDQYWAGGTHVTKEWTENYFRRIMGPLIGRQHVIDYGCGMGFAYQRQLAAAVGTYVGADAGPSAVADARKKGFGAMPINSDSGIIDCPTGEFDGAVCSEVFEHLFDPLQSAREICRILKPGGVLVATVPNFGYHAWRLQALLRAQVPSEPEHPRKNRYNGVHIRFFSKLTLKRLLADAGFENITVGSFDQSSIWDLSRCAGPFARVSDFANKHFPAPFHLRFLQDLWPSVCAIRLRAVGYKPQ